MIPLEKNQLRLQFTKIDAQAMMDRTTFDITNATFNARLSQALSAIDIVSNAEDPGMKVSTFNFSTTSALQPAYQLSLTDIVQFLISSKTQAGDHLINDSIHVNTVNCADDYLSDDSKMQCKKL